MHTDRSGEGEVRRCRIAAPRARESDDLLAPAFPDMEQFTFGGMLCRFSPNSISL